MKPSNLLRLVDASTDKVTISFDVPTGPGSRTCLGTVTFNRLTADLVVKWSLDGRQDLTVLDRIQLLFWSLKLVKSLL